MFHQLREACGGAAGVKKGKGKREKYGVKAGGKRVKNKGQEEEWRLFYSLLLKCQDIVSSKKCHDIIYNADVR
jgi:hypothetical protein